MNVLGRTISVMEKEETIMNKRIVCLICIGLVAIGLVAGCNKGEGDLPPSTNHGPVAPGGSGAGMAPADTRQKK